MCNLDCHANARLQHVHLHNFVPTQYHFRPGCKLHGAWSPWGLVDEETTDFIEWASADIWSEGAVASFKIRSPCISDPSQGAIEVKP